MNGRRQSYTPRPRWLEPSPDQVGEDDGDGDALLDGAARAHMDVEPGEVEALLRVERSA